MRRILTPIVVLVAMGVGVFVGFRLNRSATTIQEIKKGRKRME